jgi:hypothetical protein
MKFTEKNAIHLNTGTTTPVWIPEAFDYERRGEVTEITIGEETRLVLASLVHLAETFTRQSELRTQLGHDCVVFAYAHESGNDVADTHFHLPGESYIRAKKFDVRGNGNTANLADVQPGEIIFTENSQPEDDGFPGIAPHFLVRATTDSNEPLYMSKLGACGPVVLSTIEQSLALYPAQTVGVASDFYTVPPDKNH